MSSFIKLGAFLNGSGPHGGIWRHEHIDTEELGTFAYYCKLASRLQDGKFDVLFMNDTISSGLFEPDLIEKNTAATRWDTLTLLAGLSVVTDQIGLVGTANTTYNEPFTLARRLESLDRLSEGRAGWNVVTSLEGGENYNRSDHVLHATRYERAEEFVDVVLGLFNSWDDDAAIKDKESGRWFDAARVKLLNHRGKHFQVKGPLNAPRPVQGWPVIAQAGSSEAGRKLAARIGELIFTAATTIEEGRAFRTEIRQKAEREFGRNPDHLLIMPGVSVTVAETRTEAEAKFDQLHALTDNTIALKSISEFVGLGVDFSQYSLDDLAPLPAVLPDTNRHKSRQKLVADLIKRERPTVRQLLRLLSAGGHRVLVGSPTDIADDFEEWVKAGAADGFNIMTNQTFEAIDDFVRLVVPELQRRGLFKTEYAGRTLRENLYLERPERQ
ncbi:LLM class flavin-dependent oxidoreductase [Acetobacter vaccinii]|uniref:LLM class flavin-dependent oxidoreductase n=1 Tax=Acetobacter vaccinii TaxID=2592655 RepID=A0A5C1YR01_9PROT|nr:LLM class flavin-dependent oxidoreductase [Acetobacter vaccinii]QEO18163.1 LLM class flavin-dependent oxidoreductase [Acetobacter vaccinii]